MPDRWLLTDYTHSWLNGVLTVTTVSDVSCHMWLRWTTVPPRLHLRSEEDRGLKKLGTPDYCFVEYDDIEQNEAGDTLEHTFTWPGWATCYRRWYLFWATINGNRSPSNTAIFELHYLDPPVFSIGKYGESQVLEGSVKIEAGWGVDIIRDDAHNALKIGIV